MKLSSALRLVPVLNSSGSGNPVRAGWDKLRKVPGGKRLFSVAIGRYAAYTGSIDAVVQELDMGKAVITMRDQRKVRNHLRSIHAIALANLAELTGNLAVAYSMPDDARFIVAGMSIDYLKKARGTITGRCQCPVPKTSQRAEYPVPVTLEDEQGVEVARVTLRTLIGPKQTSESA